MHGSRLRVGVGGLPPEAVLSKTMQLKSVDLSCERRERESEPMADVAVKVGELPPWCKYRLLLRAARQVTLAQVTRGHGSIFTQWCHDSGFQSGAC